MKLTMQVVITGINGSGASYLAEHILNHHDNVEVHGFARWHSANGNGRDTRIVRHEVDLLDLSSILRALGKARPDVIFHMASHANVRACFDTPLSVLNNNIMGTANLLEAVRVGMAGSPPIFIMCSSSEVYGQVAKENVPIKENCSINPASPYAVSKLTQDALSHTYFLNYGIPVIRTRMFTYINPRRGDLFATSFARQIVAIERGEREELVHGNLDSVRTIIDIRDACAAYWAALLCDPGEVYNIGGETTATVGEMLDILKAHALCPIRSRQDKSLMRPTDVTLQIPDVSKFRKKTGWTPRYSLEESIEHLLSEVRGKESRLK